MSEIRKVADNIELVVEALDAFSTSSPGQDSLIKDRVMVDVGCGGGHLTRELTLRGAQVIGIDIPEMVIKAKEYEVVGDETYLQGGGENIPLEDNWADVVIFFASLHHIPVDKMMEAIKECYRVLKKNGIGIIVEPVFREGSWSELARLLRDEREIQGHAWTAIKNADQIGFIHKTEELFYFERTLEHFINHLSDHVSDKDKWQEYVNGGKKVLARLSDEAQVAPEDYRFKSYCRLNIIQKQ